LLKVALYTFVEDWSHCTTVLEFFFFHFPFYYQMVKVEFFQKKTLFLILCVFFITLCTLTQRWTEESVKLQS
jgi:hypothetical protein